MLFGNLRHSSLLLAEDVDYAMYRVVVFRKYADDFRNTAREQKCVFCLLFASILV